MENLSDLADHIAFGLVDYDEALSQLYTLRDRYGWSSATGALGSAARAHEARYGHRLRYGCCHGVSLIELFPTEEYKKVDSDEWEAQGREYMQLIEAQHRDASLEMDDGTTPRQPRR